MPSWLISAVFHTLLLVVLMLLTQGAAAPPPVTIVSEVAQLPDLAQNTTPIFIPEPDPIPNDVALSDVVDPAPLELAAPLDLQPPEVPVGIVVSAFSGADAGALLASTGKEKGKPQKGQPGAQFFGVQAAGDNFAFIVDSSMSMTQKFADAKRELEYAVRKLSPQQRFYVLFFDRNTEHMTLGTWDHDHVRFTFNAEPEPDLVLATTPHVDAFVQWMNMIQLEFATNPFEATAFAIAVLKPDAIFLLSDGEFTDGGATERFLLANNFEADADGTRHPKTIVHCLGFYSREGEVTLKRIAAANGGTYRFVEPPPGYVPLFRLPRPGMPMRRRG